MAAGQSGVRVQSFLLLSPVGSHGGEGAAEHQLAVFGFEDEIKPGVCAAVQQLQSGQWPDGSRQALRPSSEQQRKEVVMLTGACMVRRG